MFTGRESRFVSEGTLFKYVEDQQAASLTARGPLLGPLIIFVAAARNLTANASYEVVVEYVVPPAPSEVIRAFEWNVQGWSKCSRDCGGGRQQILQK